MGFWSKLVHAGVTDESQRNRIRLIQANKISVVLAALGLSAAIVFYASGLSLVGLTLGIFSVLMTGSIALNAFGYTMASRFYQPLLFASAVAVEVFLVGVHGGLTQLFIPGIAFAFLSFGGRERKQLVQVLVLTSLISVVTTVLAQLYSPILHEVDPRYYPILCVLFWVVTVWLLLTELYLFFTSVENYHRMLRNNHQLTNAILEGTSDSFLFLDEECLLKYMNPNSQAAFTSFGITEMIGKNFFDLSREMHKNDFNEELEQSVRAGVAFHREYIEPLYDRWFEVRTSPHPLGTSIVYRDIDERKRAETHLRESEAMQRAILANAGAAICVSNPQGVFQRVNPAMTKLCGYTSDELLGRSYRILSLPEEADIDNEQFRRLAAGEIESFSRQKTYLHKSGKFVYGLFQVNALREPDGEVKNLIVSIQDLTEAKEAEQRLLQAAKMSSLGEMAGSIAHEINNPMTIISLSAEQLELAAMDGAVEADQVIRVSGRITETVTRITKIIRGLKSFSRNAEHDPMVVTPLSVLVDDTLELCREKFRNKGVDLIIEDLPNVHLNCRPTELSQVLLNLLGNAFDAVEQIPGKRWVKLNAKQKENAIAIAITDCGPGIPEEIAKRILEPFYTTKELGKGTGLGLSISKGIIESHHGRLYYDRNNSNTSFVIELNSHEVA